MGISVSDVLAGRTQGADVALAGLQKARAKTRTLTARQRG